MAALLLMMSGAAACSTTSRVENAGLDPARMDDCPVAVQAPGDLPARTPFALPDGRWVVPLAEANARENRLLEGAMVYRSAYRACRSVVIYAQDMDALLGK